MLQGLRDYFPKWLFAFFIGLSGLIVVGASIYIPVQGRSQGPVLARVNKVKIRKNQLDVLVENLKHSRAQVDPSARMTVEMENELRIYCFQQLLQQEVLQQRAYQSDYRIHPKNALRWVQQHPTFQVDGQFSPRHLADILAATGQTKRSFFKAISSHQLIGQMEQSLTKSAFILPKEVQQFVRLIKQTRNFSYLELKARDFINTSDVLSEEELRAHYEASLTDFRVPEKVSFDYIELSYEDTLQSFRARNPDSENGHHEPTAETFKEVVNELVQLNHAHPRSLKEAANALHVKIQSSLLVTREGGVTEVTKHPDVLSAAFSEKVLKGENSSVIQLNSERVVLLRLREHQPLHLPAFEEVKESVAERLKLHRAQQAARAYGKELLKAMEEDTVSKPKQDHRPLVWNKVDTAQQPNEKVSPLMMQCAFGMPSKGKGLKVKGLTMPNGDYIIVRLDKVNAGKVSQLEADEYEMYKKELKQLIAQLDYSQYKRASAQRVRIRFSRAFGA